MLSCFCINVILLHMIHLCLDSTEDLWLELDLCPEILKLGNPSFPPSTSSFNSPMLQRSMPVPHLCSNFRVIFGCDARKVEIKGTCRSSTSSMNVRSAPQPPPNLQSGNTNSFRAIALGINQRRSCTAQKQRPASHGEEYISNFCHKCWKKLTLNPKYGAMFSE